MTFNLSKTCEGKEGVLVKSNFVYSIDITMNTKNLKKSSEHGATAFETKTAINLVIAGN